MAATVVLYEYTGSSAGTTTSSDKFSGASRLRNTDIATETTPVSDPIMRGGATVYSMERHLRMQATAGIITSLTNPQFYTAGTAWDTDNVLPYVKTTTSPTGATPVKPSATTGYTLAHSLLTGARKGLGTYTVTSTPNPLGDFLIAMCSVLSTATAPATAGSETWTWAYDEA